MANLCTKGLNQEAASILCEYLISWMSNATSNHNDNGETAFENMIKELSEAMVNESASSGLFVVGCSRKRLKLFVWLLNLEAPRSLEVQPGVLKNK